MVDIRATDSVTGTLTVWPTELRVAKDRRSITVAFDDGERFELPAEYLRVESPSAEVMGHSPDERKFIGGKELVEIMKIEPVGRYAVKILFDDMHDSGIYSFDYLYTLGRDHAELWARYLTGLAAAGGQRQRTSLH